MRSGGRARFFVGILVGLLLAAVIGIVVLAPLSLTHRDAGPIERAFGNAVVGLTTRLGARNVGANPVAGTPQALQAGLTAYNGVCAQCHGQAGQGDGIFGQTVFPPATDLTGNTTREMSDAQIFYIIKNGLGFTPMPAYGSHYSDQTIWSLVSYVRALQGGQGGRLPVGTPTGQQASAAQLPIGGDAQRGAVLFRSNGCVACHGSAPGQVALNPTDRMITQAVRLGQTGMPCFSPDRISDAELADIRAYIATFPALALPSGPPQGQPPRGQGGPGGGGPGGAGGPPGGGAGGPPPGGLSPCAAASGITFPPGPSGPGGAPATPTR